MIDLFTPREARDEAMGRVDDHADWDWKRLMEELVLRVSRTKQYFTADDIWDAYYALPKRPTTHEDRALGPVMMRASKQRICRKTGRFVKCRRTSRHHTDLAVWESLVYHGDR